MKYVHVIMAVISVWRVVELFTIDKITEKLRVKFPSYLWQCQRCMSVWAGAYATLAFIFLPWLNWPFALSWFYFTHNEWIANRRMNKKGRQLLIEIKDGKWNIPRNELAIEEIKQILASAAPPQAPQHVNGAANPAT